MRKNIALILAGRFCLGGTVTLTQHRVSVPKWDDTVRKLTSVLEPVYESYNVGSFTVSEQPFGVLFSTGGINMCLPSANCPEVWITGPNCSGSQCGISSYSGAYSDTGRTFSVNFPGEDEVGGKIVLVNASLGNISFSGLAVGLVTKATERSGYMYGGVIGLTRAGTLVSSLYASNRISSNLFTFFNPPGRGEGILTLGAVDPTLYSGTLIHLPNIGLTSWKINLNKISVGESSPVSSSGTAIIDSGNSLIIGPSSAVSDLMQSIQSVSGLNVTYNDGTGIYFVPCSVASTLPNVTFTVSGSDNLKYDISIPGNALIHTDLSDGTNCAFGIQAATSSYGADWIFGDVFMRQFFIVFDYGNSRISLAVAAFNTTTEISVSTNNANNFAPFIGSLILILSTLLLH